MRHTLQGLIAGLIVATIGLILGLTPVGSSFEQSVGLKAMFKLRGPRPSPTSVAVIAIDDRSGGQLGLSSLPREWPRAVHGRLVERLTALGASAIVFDFDFQTPKRPEDDEAFAKAIKSSGRVVLAEKLVGKRQPILDAHGKPSGSIWLEQLVLPIPSLADAARGLGPFPLPKVQEAVHDFWVFKPSVGDAPTMPMVAFQIHAMPAYAKLRNRLLELDAAPDEGLPEVSMVGRAPDLRRLMAQLRSLFLKEETLGSRIADISEQSSGDSRATPNDVPLSALIHAYSGPDQRYLNFYGPPGTIETIPYATFLKEGDQTPEPPLPNLRNRVAFVGFSDLYDPGQPDRFFTVFTNEDGVDLSGVEIAATAFANLTDDSSLATLDPLPMAGLLSAAGGLLGTLVYLLPAIAGVPLSLITAASYAGWAYQRFVEAHFWYPMATPLLVQLPLALFIGLISHYLRERHKKNEAKRAISYYLPENIARDFTEKGGDLSTVNRVVYGVCLASDMAGFTTIAETMPPKELAAFLNDYFETLSAPLKRHHVSVIEFRADGIMCAWTADQPDVNARRQAIQAALSAVDAINKFRERHHGQAQAIRIGLETGMVYVGHAGGGGHFVYSIVGDSANIAARVEGLNKVMGTQLLVTSSVIEGVDKLLYRSLGEFRFVGKSEPLPIVEIMATNDTATDDQRRLCEAYDGAMVILRTQPLAEAAKSFTQLLSVFPDDGPIKFHAERCQQLLVQGETSDMPWVITLNTK